MTKKSILSLMLSLALILGNMSFAFAATVNELTIPGNSIVIGEHLFTLDTNASDFTLDNFMTATRSISGNNKVYYKKAANGKWYDLVADSTMGQPVSLSSILNNITKKNGDDLDTTAEADLVLNNGAIYTMDDENRTASAIVVAGDEIIYVGDDAGAEEYIGNGTEVIDLDGKMVTPGFIDGHTHPITLELEKKFTLYLGDKVPTVESYQDALKEFVDNNPQLAVINGSGMQVNAFPDWMPHKSVLDEVVSDRAVVITDTSSHGMLLNSKALEICGITRDTEAPDGAQIYKDEDGEPTGFIVDGLSLAVDVLTQVPMYTEGQIKEAYFEYQDNSSPMGLTSFHCAGLLIDGFSNDSAWKMIDDLSQSNELKMRANIAIFDLEFTKESAEDNVKALDEGQKYVSDFQNVNMVKTIVDGVPEGKTVLLLEPYAEGADMPDDYKGPQYCTQEQMDESVEIVDKAGYQMQVHAMGDGGANVVLNSFERAQNKNGKRDSRHVIAHASFVDKEDITRMGELGVYSAMQPIWFYRDPIFSALELQNLGQERFDRLYAAREIRDAGVVITGSADYPVTVDYRPLVGIEVGVTQGSPYQGEQGDEKFVRNADQTLTVMDMLEIYTINGAKQMFMEDKIGSLEVGKKADMVILGEDITKINPVDISETEIVNTIFDGKIIYSK